MSDFELLGYHNVTPNILCLSMKLFLIVLYLFNMEVETKNFCTAFFSKKGLNKWLLYKKIGLLSSVIVLKFEYSWFIQTQCTRTQVIKESIRTSIRTYPPCYLPKSDFFGFLSLWVSKAQGKKKHRCNTPGSERPRLFLTIE